MSENPPLSSAPTALGHATPIFRVKNLRASLDTYVNALGFKIDWEAAGPIASVSRDRCCIFLSEGDQGNPGSWVWIGVGDVAALHEELRGKGAIIRHPPTNYWWACEMQVADPDGNVLRIGSEPKPNEPFGEWLDMHGIRWAQSPSGEWTRVNGG
jgi:catechol 2,3-dioxygenase-like lactoylglutathione lyase family enzyme